MASYIFALKYHLLLYYFMTTVYRLLRPTADTDDAQLSSAPPNFKSFVRSANSFVCVCMQTFYVSIFSHLVECESPCFDLFTNFKPNHPFLLSAVVKQRIVFIWCVDLNVTKNFIYIGGYQNVFASACVCSGTVNALHFFCCVCENYFIAMTAINLHLSITSTLKQQ